MVAKRQNVTAAIESDMAGRNIGRASDMDGFEAHKVSETTLEASQVFQKTTKGYKNTVVSVRFDEGDYERLKIIAAEQGTTGASLIRKAVKDIISGK